MMAEREFGGDAENKRRASLKIFAKSLSIKARAGQMTDLDAFTTIFEYASRPFPEDIGSNAFLEVMLDDLRAVLIGEGWKTALRNTGPFALGFNAFLDTGFKPEFRDGGNQVQHAMAGLYLSFFHGWLAERLLILQEDGAEDLALYRATFDIASYLNGSTLKTFHHMMRQRLGA